MNENLKKNMNLCVEQFRLPRYEEIPDVGLYLEQTAKYITQIYEPLLEQAVTTSMISNYVKKGLIESPVKKQYDRERISHLIFIVAAKTVLSMESIKTLIGIQRKTYESPVAYAYFCMELENVLQFTFGLKPTLAQIGEREADFPEEKALLRNTIVTVANKLYLDQWLRLLQEAEGQGLTQA